jgi:predicted membrane metal-binding protein
LLAEDLRRWLRDEPIQWQRATWLARMMLAWRRNPRAFVAKAAIWVLLLATLLSMSVALAQWKVAQQQRSNAIQAINLRQQAEKMAEDQAELTRHWEQAAREREEWRKQVSEGERARVAMRERQRARVKLALEQGQLFDATIVLLNLAEEIQELNADDKTQLELFVNQLNELIEAARQNKAAPLETP